MSVYDHLNFQTAYSRIEILIFRSRSFQRSSRRISKLKLKISRVYTPGDSCTSISIDLSPKVPDSSGPSLEEMHYEIASRFL